MRERDTTAGHDITLRRAGPADAAEIARLSQAFRQELGEPSEHLSEAAVLRDGFGDNPEFQVFLAEIAGDSVGYALFLNAYEPTYAEAGTYLADLYVVPGARRRSVARNLVAAVAADTRRRGRTFVWWISMSDNSKAEAFYRSLGVSVVATKAYAATRFSTFDRLAKQALPVA